MEQHKIDRINHLARKAREEGLSEAEAAEREVRRGEYRAAVRENLRAALDNTYIMDEKGNKRPLKKKTGK